MDSGVDAEKTSVQKMPLCFRIEDMQNFVIPRMLEFSAVPSFTCDLPSTYHLFQPILLLLRFLPQQDFTKVAEILRQIFMTISNQKKLAVVCEILALRNVEGSKISTLDGNLLIWFTKAILSSRCNSENGDKDIDKLREILCGFFLTAIEDCVMGYKFVEECLYVIHQDISVPSVIRDNEAQRLIMWLFLQIRTKVAMKAAENKFESSWGKPNEFVKNLCKLLEFLGNYFFFLSSALSPDTYDK
jgi:hypothetical protein